MNQASLYEKAYNDGYGDGQADGKRWASRQKISKEFRMAFYGIYVSIIVYPVFQFQVADVISITGLLVAVFYFVKGMCSIDSLARTFSTTTYVEKPEETEEDAEEESNKPEENNNNKDGEE